MQEDMKRYKNEAKSLDAYGKYRYCNFLSEARLRWCRTHQDCCTDGR